MQQLSGQDASFVYMETPRTPMHIGSVAIYDPSTAPGGFVRFKDILGFIEQRLAGARAFRQRLVRVPFDLDHPYWIEDPDFDLEYHARHVALPQPGDWRQLCIQVARLHSRAMDMSKPLWEFTVVEGLDNIPGLPKGCFALVSKVHHAAIDGMSGVEMSAALHDLTAEIGAGPVDNWKPEAVPNTGELMMRGYVNGLSQPLKAMETIGRSLPGFAKLTQGVGTGNISLKEAKTAPKTVLNGSVSAHRVFDAVPLPLAEVRAIKSTLEGATVNDAILAIVGGGLRHYLNSRDANPKESLKAMAPISVRSEGEKKDLGNQVSAMVVGLGTHIEDPVERLKYVHEQSSNSKAMTNAVGARTLADYSKLAPASLAALGSRLYTELGISRAHDPAFNCVVTNVPGSPVPLYFAGAKMVAMYGMGPVFDSMGLINPIYSYGDTIAISFTSDRKLMPDPANYAAALKQSFEELKAATIGGGGAPAKKAAAKKPVAKKPVAKKAAPKKPAARKPVAKKATTRKPAAKKA